MLLSTYFLIFIATIESRVREDTAFGSLSSKVKYWHGCLKFRVYSLYWISKRLFIIYLFADIIWLLHYLCFKGSRYRSYHLSKSWFILHICAVIVDDSKCKIATSSCRYVYCCHVQLSLLAIQLNDVTVTLSLPSHFGADHLKQEWCLTELFVFSVVIWLLIIWLLTL